MTRNLSQQEEKVVLLATQGLTDKGIAEKMEVSVNTILTYWIRIRAKTGLATRQEITAYFASNVVQEELVAVRQELDALSRVIEYAPEALLVVRGDGVIVQGNQAAAELLGCSVADFNGLRVGKFIPPELHESHKNLREKYVKQPTRIAMADGQAVEILRFDGSRFLGYVSVNMPTGADELAIVMVRT